MCTVIDIIPFNHISEMQLLLRQNKNEDIDIIDHRVVIYKSVIDEYDDRI